MKFTHHEVRRRFAIFRLMTTASLIGLVYPVFTNEYNDPRALLNGFLIGFIGSFIIAMFEFVIFNPHSRRLSFIKVLTLKIILYFLAFITTIVTVKVTIDSLFFKMGFLEYFKSDLFRHFIYEEDFKVILAYTLFFLIIIVFTMQISRKLGYKTFVNAITGKYHHPREEDRIFMFVDIHSSTAIADRVGDLVFHEFLNDFYSDITKCILASHGEIFRYVGDEVGITWLKDKGLKNANCIRTLFYINYEMNKQKEKYINKYGFTPTYTAYLHMGPVITSEIGDIKRQINYNGDVLYRLSEIEKTGKSKGVSLLISEELKNALPLPEIYQYELCASEDSEKHQPRCYTIKEVF